jgi:putative membrane protein
LALDAICRSIEISLRESIGDELVLKPLTPVNYCLM